jgi:hypothetical protein
LASGEGKGTGVVAGAGVCCGWACATCIDPEGASSAVIATSVPVSIGIACTRDTAQSAKKPASQIAVTSRCNVTVEPARVRAKMTPRE